MTDREDVASVRSGLRTILLATHSQPPQRIPLAIRRACNETQSKAPVRSQSAAHADSGREAVPCWSRSRSRRETPCRAGSNMPCSRPVKCRMPPKTSIVKRSTAPPRPPVPSRGHCATPSKNSGGCRSSGPSKAQPSSRDIFRNIHRNSKVGTDQVRFRQLEGNKLFITSAPVSIPDPNGPDRMMIGYLVWEKEQ